MNGKVVEIVTGGTRHNVAIKEYQGNRVVTFRDIDELHERPEGTAKRNFRENRKHFIEGENYFVRNSSEAQNEFGIIAPNGLILLTESGYLMLVKSLTDDLAWQVQRQLVKSYFQARGFFNTTELLLELIEKPAFQSMKATAQAALIKSIANSIAKPTKEKSIAEKSKSTNQPAITSATTSAEKLQILLDAAISIDEFNPRSETELKSSVIYDKKFYYILSAAIERYLGANINKGTIHDAIRFLDGKPWSKRFKLFGKSKTYYTLRIPRKVIDIDIDRTPAKVYQLPEQTTFSNRRRTI